MRRKLTITNSDNNQGSFQNSYMNQYNITNKNVKNNNLLVCITIFAVQIILIAFLIFDLNRNEERKINNGNGSTFLNLIRLLCVFTLHL